MSEHFHPLVKRLLDGEITIADLPAELRPEGTEALRLLAAVDRRPVQLADLTERVMASLAQRKQPTIWRRIVEPRELRLRVRPWLLAPALAAAAAVVLWLGPSDTSAPPSPSAGLVMVRFVLTAPDAHTVGVAGTFNQWDASVTPLVRTEAAGGVWTATITLPAGQHQYAFVVDGARWVPDPAAPAVADGFGRRNSVLTL